MADALRRLNKEKKKIDKDSETDGWYQVAYADEDGRENKFKWMVTIMGPEEYAVNPSADGKEDDGPRPSPYRDGMFMVAVDFPNTYPTAPPKIKFETPVYHPNIKSTGEVCSDFLSKGWRPNLGVKYVIDCLRTLLAEPNGTEPLEPEIGRQYNESIDAFDKQARENTERFAMD
eukprot:CAMPEP_0203806420 /NCGR_PEP_ID=MMETSP0115-20131106/454_1 /ASSEMBLY_ACC=CAM_ASM_000227 /TAXON_ID=33651 /ORGANISM="Bicosoecid sp, Strain ms1" /LENGTH=173 /DNA_ID=CAMNT_0050715077 /DNA_START=54 /DNA_END=575 /DNA_ORIENTATION=-